MILISLFFMVIMVVSVFNDIFLNIWEIRKSIGVYTLIGFTHGQLRGVMLWKTFLVSLAGILLAIPLVVLVGPRFMGSITSGMGIVDFPFSLSGLYSLLVYLFLLGATAVSAAWASGSMKKISPRILVNE
jgi:ABC-type antimicrobial peptide transport system permease subunit